MPSVLILGGAGFIGSHLAEVFTEKGCKVSIIDSLNPICGGRIENLKGILDNITFIQSEIEKVCGLESIIEKTDIIIDSMGFTSHHLALQNPILDLKLNVENHLHFIKTLRYFPNKKVISLGSRSQYGRMDSSIEQMDENVAQSPIDVHGIHKMTNELHYEVFANKYHFHVLSLRIVNCFGERQKYEGPDIGLVGQFIREAIDGKAIQIFGSGERLRQFIYVKDLASEIYDLAIKKWKAEEAFKALNIIGFTLSFSDLAKKIISFTNNSTPIKVCPFPPEIKLIDVGNCLLRSKDDTLPLWNYSELALRKTFDYFQSIRNLNETISI